MAREKVTITLDREKAETARALLDVTSTSEAIDQALARLIKHERTRRDVVAYLSSPLVDEEIATGKAATVVASGFDDDTDWEALYGDVDG